MGVMPQFPEAHRASRLPCKPFKPGLFLHKWESNLCWPQESGGKCRCSENCERCYLLGKEAGSFLLHQFSSAAQSCLTLCDPMDCSTPGFPVHHQLPECAQTHVHQVSDAIQPSRPLSCPSPPLFNHSQHQGLFNDQLFESGGQSIGASASASVLPMNIQGWLPLGWTVLISLQSKGLSRVFSNTTVQKHQFFGAQLSLWSKFHIHTQAPGKPKNTGVGSLSLLQGIFLTQESNQGLLHCRQILYQLSDPGSPPIA